MTPPAVEHFGAGMGLCMNSSSPSETPWTFDQVYGVVAQRFASTPYAVTREGDQITVQADLADKTYVLAVTWVTAVNLQAPMASAGAKPGQFRRIHDLARARLPPTPWRRYDKSYSSRQVTIAARAPLLGP